MSACFAWLLELDGGRFAAVGELEMVHVMPQSAALFTIPETPAYCCRIVAFDGALVPVMNLGARIGVAADSAASADAYFGICCYEDERHAAHYGALSLARAPLRVQVDDAQACPLPEDEPGWRRFAVSCFDHPGDGAVPILDLATVFAGD